MLNPGVVEHDFEMLKTAPCTFYEIYRGYQGMYEIVYSISGDTEAVL